MKHNIKRVYLDYNIYDGLSKKQFEINRNNVEVYCSVAHIEEYFKASKNANNINNTEKLLQVKKTILDLSKKEIILNPSKTRIVAKAESFDTCYDRISNMDTTKIIETDSNSIFSNIKNSVQQIQTADSTAKNYSNLDEKEIW